MITRHSSPAEIDSYYEAKIAEFMALVDELERLKGRSQDAGRRNFLDTWKLYDSRANRMVVVDQSVKWLDGEIAQMTRLVEARRNR